VNELKLTELVTYKVGDAEVTYKGKVGDVKLYERCVAGGSTLYYVNNRSKIVGILEILAGSVDETAYIAVCELKELP
jgi:hypothetical protein